MGKGCSINEINTRILHSSGVNTKILENGIGCIREPENDQRTRENTWFRTQSLLFHDSKPRCCKTRGGGEGGAGLEILSGVPQDAM